MRAIIVMFLMSVSMACSAQGKSVPSAEQGLGEEFEFSAPRLNDKSWPYQEVARFWGKLAIGPKRPVKGETDTSAAHQENLVEWAKTRVGAFAGEKVVAFRSCNPQQKYDADKGKLTVSFIRRIEKDPPTGLYRNFLNLEQTERAEGEYAAKNAFGVKVDVQAFTVTHFGVMPTDSKAFDKFQLKQIAMPVAKAKSDGLQVCWAVIGKMVSPYSQIIESHDIPKIDWPYDRKHIFLSLRMNVKGVWLFNPRTGEVYSKTQFK